jgi:hypothetical protein
VIEAEQLAKALSMTWNLLRLEQGSHATNRLTEAA